MARRKVPNRPQNRNLSLKDFVETSFTTITRSNHHFERPTTPNFCFKKPIPSKKKSTRSKAKSKWTKSFRDSSGSFANKALQIPEILLLIIETLASDILNTSKFTLLSELDLSRGFIRFSNQDTTRPAKVIARYLAIKELCRLKRINRMWCEIIRTAPFLQQILRDPPNSLDFIWSDKDWFGEPMHAFQFDLETLTTKEDVNCLGYDPNYLTQITPRCDKLSSKMMEVKGIDKYFPENEHTTRGCCLLVYRPRCVLMKNVKQSNSEKYIHPPWHYSTSEDTRCTTCEYIAAWAWARA